MNEILPVIKITHNDVNTTWKQTTN